MYKRYNPSPILFSDSAGFHVSASRRSVCTPLRCSGVGEVGCGKAVCAVDLGRRKSRILPRVQNIPSSFSCRVPLHRQFAEKEVLLQKHRKASLNLHDVLVELHTLECSQVVIRRMFKARVGLRGTYSCTCSADSLSLAGR